MGLDSLSNDQRHPDDLLDLGTAHDRTHWEIDCLNEATKKVQAMAGKSQAEYWNDEAGPKWVEHGDALDSMLAPFLEKIMARVKLRSTDRVLDIGCGAGALSLRAAESVGHVTGVDVSEPLLNLARQRASRRENIAFHHVDAAEMSASSTNPFDIALSRFGVMFFEEPVKTFQNILQLMSDRPSLVFACWRHPKYNP